MEKIIGNQEQLISDQDLREIIMCVARLRMLLVGTGDKALYTGKPSAGLKELERRALVALARMNAPDTPPSDQSGGAA